MIDNVNQNASRTYQVDRFFEVVVVFVHAIIVVWAALPLTFCVIFQNVITVNSTMENHRQWRITRKYVAEFLKIYTKFYLLCNSVIYFHLCLEVWLKSGVKIPPDNKIRVAETLDPLTMMPSLLLQKSDVQIKCVSYPASKHLIMTTFALL